MPKPRHQKKSCVGGMASSCWRSRLAYLLSGIAAEIMANHIRESAQAISILYPQQRRGVLCRPEGQAVTGEVALSARAQLRRLGAEAPSAQASRA